MSDQEIRRIMNNIKRHLLDNFKRDRLPVYDTSLMIIEVKTTIYRVDKMWLLQGHVIESKYKKTYKKSYFIGRLVLKRFALMQNPILIYLPVHTAYEIYVLLY